MLKNGSAKIKWRASGEAVEFSVASMNAIAGTAITHANRATLSRRRRQSKTAPTSASRRTGVDQA
jgi:hypothetical protein